MRNERMIMCRSDDFIDGIKTDFKNSHLSESTNTNAGLTTMKTRANKLDNMTSGSTHNFMGQMRPTSGKAEPCTGNFSRNRN